MFCRWPRVANCLWPLSTSLYILYFAIMQVHFASKIMPKPTHYNMQALNRSMLKMHIRPVMSLRITIWIQTTIWPFMKTRQTSSWWLERVVKRQKRLIKKTVLVHTGPEMSRTLRCLFLLITSTALYCYLPKLSLIEHWMSAAFYFLLTQY